MEQKRHDKSWILEPAQVSFSSPSLLLYDVLYVCINVYVCMYVYVCMMCVCVCVCVSPQHDRQAESQPPKARGARGNNYVEKRHNRSRIIQEEGEEKKIKHPKCSLSW